MCVDGSCACEDEDDGLYISVDASWPCEEEDGGNVGNNAEGFQWITFDPELEVEVVFKAVITRPARVNRKQSAATAYWQKKERRLSG